MLRLKENFTIGKYNEINNKALACEIGYFIGTMKNIDDYIKENLISKVGGADEYIIFYMFCEFVVDCFNDSGVSSIYILVEYNYMKLVYMFIEKFFEEIK